MKSNILKSSALGVIVVSSICALAWWRLSVSTGEQVSEEAPAPISVRAQRVEKGSVQSWVFAEGTARSVRREYMTFENPGRVSFVLAGQDGEALREGTPVRMGVLLARQDQRSARAELASAQAAIEEAGTQVTVAEAEESRAQSEQELARTTLERYSILIQKNSASKQEYDQAQNQANIAAATVSQAASRRAASQAMVSSAEARLKQAELALEETDLIAPMDGIVAYVNIKEGYYFTPSMIRTDEESAALQSVPIVIIDPTAFEVTVNVPSFNRGRVRPGQAAVIVVSSVAAASLGSERPPLDGEGSVRGTVFSVNPAVSPGGRAVQVKLRATGDVQLLEDGLFVTVWIAANRREDVLRVPVDAVLHQDNSPYVFTIEAGKAVRKEVILGLREFSMQEVTEGLGEGQLVITQGRFKMSEGVSVEILGQTGGTL